VVASMELYGGSGGSPSGGSACGGSDATWWWWLRWWWPAAPVDRACEGAPTRRGNDYFGAPRRWWHMRPDVVIATTWWLRLSMLFFKKRFAGRYVRHSTKV
jgi:hypothetical protein